MANNHPATPQPPFSPKQHWSRFIVIGASGFIGKHILSEARLSGFASVGTRADSDERHLIHFDLLKHRIQDCLNFENAAGSEAVFGVVCACISQIDRCFEKKDLSRFVNVEKTILLIDDMKRLGIKPVFLSSSFVHDGRMGYYDETQPCRPICEYGRHKAEVERHLMRSGSEALVLRLDKVVGDDPEDPHLFTQWQACIHRGMPIRCMAGQVFSPTHVKDVARSVIIGCCKGLSGLYNVANPEFFSRKELAHQFVHMMGFNKDIRTNTQEELNFKDYRPLKTYLDSSKFIDATDIRFTSMRRTISNFRKRASGRHGSR